MVKRIIHPTTGAVLACLGRRRPAGIRRKLHFHNYLKLSTLPTPPVSCDYSPLALPALRKIYLNATYGCCVEAGAFHMQGIFTGNAGRACEIFADANVKTVYSAWGGFDPRHPQTTDNGTDEETAWTDWQKNGLINGQNKIAGWMNIDAANVQEYTAAAWLFESLAYGVELPDAWISPFPSHDGFVWDVAGYSNPENGHCFVTVGYKPNGAMIIDTWALFGTITAAANAKYATQGDAGAMYAIISQDSLNKATKKAPAGVDWQALVHDFNNLGGSLTLFGSGSV